MLNSSAYRSLNPTARAVLVELYRRHNGSNNGDIPLSVREAAEAVNVTKDTANKALWDIVDRGFARIMEKGAFKLKARHATTWWLTEFDGEGKMGTRDFMYWQPPPKIQNTVPTNRTDSPKFSDAEKANGGETASHNPKIQDRDPVEQAAVGPDRSDTTNLPRWVARGTVASGQPEADDPLKIPAWLDRRGDTSTAG